MSRRLLLISLAGLGVLCAQDPPARVGRLSLMQGTVSFQPAGVTDWAPASLNRPLSVGDQIFVDNGGFAEVRIPGTAFRLGSRTAFQFLNLDDHTAQVRLSEGPLNIRVMRLEGNLEIDTPNLALTITQPGEYRLDTNPDSVQSYVTCRAGEGQVTGNGGSFVIHAGQQAVIQGQEQNAQYQVYRAPAYDEFDNWAMSRDRVSERYSHPRYVSADMVGAEDLEQYGNWRQDSSYGQVWYPNNVASGWAPYHDGSWSWVEPWGWTWVDDSPWGFAPFHYGRWAYINGGWGWCPGPVNIAPVYAPALVAWVGFGGGGFGASFGFGGGADVGWFPLGPRDVYVPSFGASAAYVNRINISNTRYVNNTTITNVYNNYTRSGNVAMTSYQNRTAPGAMVAVSQSALASGRPVRQSIVKIQPNQIASLKGAVAAPRVAPQVASVLGRPASGSIARPPAAALNRPVVARTTPPPAPPSFQQRQSILAKNPGQPIPVAQLHQMAHNAPPPAVHVAAQTHMITPHVVNAPAPRNMPAPAPATRAATPTPAAAPHPFEPPTAQHPATPNAANASHPFTPPPAHTQTPVPNAQMPSRAATPSAHPFEPPSAQHPGQAPMNASRPTAPNAPNARFVPPSAQHPAPVPQNMPSPSRTAQQQRPAPTAPQSAFVHQAPPPHVAPQRQAPAPPPPHMAVTRPAPPPPARPVPPPQPHVAPARPAPPPPHMAVARPAPPPPHAAPPSPRPAPPAPRAAPAPPPRPAPPQQREHH